MKPASLEVRKSPNVCVMCELDVQTRIEATHLNRRASVPSASPSPSWFLFRFLLFPVSKVSSLVTVPPSHSIILRTKVNISVAVRLTRQTGARSLENDQCWSRSTSNSSTRVEASQGMRTEWLDWRTFVTASSTNKHQLTMKTQAAIRMFT